MLEKFFGRHDVKGGNSFINNSDEAFAPNTKIAYKPNLISELKRDHRDLQNLYARALHEAHAGLNVRTKKLLGKFKDNFVAHLLKENTSLYLYLQHAETDDHSKKVMRLVKSEMDKKVREVKKFLELALDKDTVIDANFVKKMVKIGHILAKLIDREEDYLFPKYGPRPS